jgi:D-alanyl-D-alanine dipeptidase
MNQTDQAARREYWTQQMEEAYEFMKRMLVYPVQECGETLASLTEAVAATGVEVEFSTSKVVGDFDRIYYLREGLIDDFIAIARDMNARGWVLKVEDGFRTTTIQKYLARKPNVFDAILQRVIWECGGQSPAPDFMLRRVTSLCATFPKIGTHMSASAIDISVLHRDDRTEIDRGGPYLEMSELTPMTSPFAPPHAQENRRQIREVMEQHGFMAYPYEFWHFNKGDCYAEALNKTGKPARYGAIHWNPQDNTINPVPNPTDSLQPAEEIEREIKAALQRLRIS